jgi:hypothetical protein
MCIAGEGVWGCNMPGTERSSALAPISVPKVQRRQTYLWLARNLVAFYLALSTITDKKRAVDSEVRVQTLPASITSDILLSRRGQTSTATRGLCKIGHRRIVVHDAALAARELRSAVDKASNYNDYISTLRAHQALGCFRAPAPASPFPLAAPAARGNALCWPLLPPPPNTRLNHGMFLRHFAILTAYDCRSKLKL